jgi:hypothetical protein
MKADDCIVLKRFVIADASLGFYCFFRNYGIKSLIAKDFYLRKGEISFSLEAFEPFNMLFLSFEQRNNTLNVISYVKKKLFYKYALSNFHRFIFMSELNRTILKLQKYTDEELFNRLIEYYEITNHFRFYLLRFYVEISLHLGLSVESLSAHGWIDLASLKPCSYRGKNCVYISPAALLLLKDIERGKIINPSAEELNLHDQYLKSHLQKNFYN